VELTDFISKLALAFEDAETSSIKPDSKFRDLEGYSSLVALSIMAVVDEEYNIQLRGDDIRKAITVEDLFNTVNAKL